ncbi:unnamed protein product, partial [Prorocentrum cordatum]
GQREAAEAQRAPEEAVAQQAREHAEAQRAGAGAEAEGQREAAEAQRAPEEAVAQQAREHAEAQRAGAGAEAEGQREAAEAQRAPEEVVAQQAREHAEAQRAGAGAEAEGQGEAAEAQRAPEEAVAQQARDDVAAQRAREEAAALHGHEDAAVQRLSGVAEAGFGSRSSQEGVPVGGPPSREKSEESRCDALWGSRCLEQPLTRTATITTPLHNASFAHYSDHRIGLQGLFISPSLGFAMCTIEKNGCSRWNAVLAKMSRGDPRWECGGKDPSCEQSVWSASRQSYSRKGAEEVFRNRSATRAVFVREPLERFASAFLDKCHPTRYRGHTAQCAPKNELAARPRHISFEAVVGWALQRNLSGGNLDGHWLLQARHCELHARVRDFTVVGLMQKDSFGADSSCLLERAGLQRFNMGRDGKPLFMRAQKLGSGWGAPNGFVAHGTQWGTSEEEAVLQKLYTPEAARAMIRHMREDYQTFGFPAEPAWVARASGEWFSQVWNARWSYKLHRARRLLDVG